MGVDNFLSAFDLFSEGRFWQLQSLCRHLISLATAVQRALNNCLSAFKEMGLGTTVTGPDNVGIIGGEINRAAPAI